MHFVFLLYNSLQLLHSLQVTDQQSSNNMNNKIVKLYEKKRYNSIAKKNPPNVNEQTDTNDINRYDDDKCQS